MNKRGMVLLLVLFLLLPSALATIELNSGLSGSYNLGDSISVSGSIVMASDADFYMETAIVCGSSSRTMVRRVVSGLANIPAEFNDNLKLFGFEPSNCRVDIILKDIDNKVIEFISSDDFIITKKLIGNFTKSREKVQLGQFINYMGKVLTQSGKEVNGYAMITLKQGTDVFYSDSIDVKEGDFGFEKKMENYPAGKATFEAKIFDIYGNSGIFIDEPGFEIISLLNINPVLNSAEVLPGKELLLSGTAQTALGEQIFNGDFEIFILDANYRYSFEGNNFKYSLLIPENIKSGTHQLLIKLSDNYGNKGEASIPVSIIPVPTDITHNLETVNFLPGEIIKFNPTLVDQAGDIISESLEVIISDGLFNSQVMSGESISFEVPGNTEPGEYKLDLSSGKINKKIGLIILEKMEVLPYLDGNDLVLSNIGNVKYSDEVIITFNQGMQIKEVVTLKPGQNTTIDLSTGLATGRYDIQVSIADKNHEFSSIDIISSEPFKYKTLVTVFMVLIFVVILIFMFLKLRRDHITFRKSEFEPTVSRKKIIVHEDAPEKSSKESKNKAYVPPTKEQEIEDYKRMVLKEVERVERESRNERGRF